MVNAPKKQLPSWWKDGVVIYQVRKSRHIVARVQWVDTSMLHRSTRRRSRTTMVTDSATCAA